jgi:hypothetical protein
LDEIRNLTRMLTDALNPATEKIDEVKKLLNDGEAVINSNNVTKYAIDVSSAEVCARTGRRITMDST